ncbi:hypothetical protein P3T27_003859 [Kitasatospora sp. MAA19]|uniref:hypothetical protein n=1 Tax=unclassified Kitasatospora TaxID=2633591 RepID=UPI0024730885|nr:hypothetical protein [Kitasatospora sp. MAA19]MDH6707130.1 hypothetical protein [Kitasatospora sp. MAA19]
MRNGLVQLGAWAAATGAAVALSWLGVHAVLTGAAFEQPTALPLPSPRVDGTPHTATATPDQGRPATQTAAPSPPASPAAATTTTTRGPAAPTAATAPQPTRRPTPTATATSSVKSYPVPGGKVALDIRPDKASLVSATPDPGWQMQVWNGDQWMRVDFTRGEQANSVFVYWNGHPPVVETAIR